MEYDIIMKDCNIGMSKTPTKSTTGINFSKLYNNYYLQL